jgi:hypothetical protein
MRSANSWRTRAIDGVACQSRAGSGFSHAAFGKCDRTRCSQTRPASSFQCSTEPPGIRIS